MAADYMQDMVGKKLEEITVSDDKQVITFTFQDGTTKKMKTYADCCSGTWIEHLETPAGLCGAEVLAVADVEMPPWDGHECPEEIDWKRACGHESLAVYHTRLCTDRGYVVIEYRNDSNGYYGGDLEPLE